MSTQKEITEELALSRLAAACSRREHCTGEMLEKMRQWKLSDEAQARIIKYLTENIYIDDERFARLFVRDKMTFNKWGRKKIEQALWMKRIDEKLISDILDEIDKNEWKTILLPLLKAKRKTIKAESDYDCSMKLIRFALSRGFTMDVIHDCL